MDLTADRTPPDRDNSADHKALARRLPWLPLVLLALLIPSAVLSLSIGPADLSARDTLLALAGMGSDVAIGIVQEIRVPRVILAVAVGGILGLAGAALQGYLRNPLAEPSVLGASNGAAFGGVIALYFGFAAAWSLALPLMAVTGALVTLGLVILLARLSASPLVLILAGLAVGTMAGAAISLALNLSPNPFAAMEITFWLLGSLEDRSMRHVVLALPLIAMGAALLLWDRRALDALSLGPSVASSLGIDLRFVQLRLLLGVAIGVGAAVAVSGAIGFVGLIVPHLLRPLVAQQPSRLLIPSALGGALLLVLADAAVRVIPSTNELRLGVITAFLGLPFFILLVVRSRRLG